jgi:hypothetical protein
VTRENYLCDSKASLKASSARRLASRVTRA